MKIEEFYNEVTGITLLRYRSPKGLISLSPPTHYTMGCWEIYCLEGDLFEDIERFDTKEEAEARIKKLLG